MGRTALIFLALLFIFIFIFRASAFDFTYTCSKSFDEYYYGSEYLYFHCTLKPESDSDAEKMAGVDYEIRSFLDTSAIQVEVVFEDGKVMLHPLPDDEYFLGNFTSLTFHVPKLDAVAEIVVRIQGYVPVPDTRLENLTVLSVYTDEKLFDRKITVVNKQKFYDDFKNFARSECADESMLSEARAYFNDGRYLKAESIMAKIEENIRECQFRAEREKYEHKLESVRNELTELRKNLMVIELKLGHRPDQIENYEEIASKLAELKTQVEVLEKAIDRIDDLIRDGIFDRADEELENVSLKITSLQYSLTQIDIKRRSFDWLLVISISASIILAAIVILMRRSRDKW